MDRKYLLHSIYEIFTDGLTLRIYGQELVNFYLKQVTRRTRNETQRTSQANLSILCLMTFSLQIYCIRVLSIMTNQPIKNKEEDEFMITSIEEGSFCIQEPQHCCPFQHHSLSEDSRHPLAQRGTSLLRERLCTQSLFLLANFSNIRSLKMYLH
jgi:hypothetical protein